MAKTILYLIRHDGLLAEEALDSAMTLAAFGQKVTVLLLDDAVNLLIEPIHGQLKALPLYDINDIRVESESLAGRTPPKWVRTIQRSAWPHLAEQVDVVLRC